MRALQAIVFSSALGVRLLYLFDASSGPSFAMPIVDSQSYDQLARELLRGETSGRLFYQGSFYPLVLAAIYATTGGSIVAAKIVQAVVGAATCALTARLGTTLFDRSTGFAAGLVAAFYAPLVFFDGELLATGWAAFFCAALLVAVLAVEARPRPLAAAGFGVLAALATTTRATFLPFAIFAAGWLVWRTRTRLTTCAARLSFAGALAAGFALVALPLAAWNASLTGRFSPLPHSGGLNLYIGNNPDREATTAVRPVDFERFAALPQFHGVRGAAGRSAFFTDRVIAYAKNEPSAFLGGLLDKTVEFVSPRELPRNVDIYTFRDDSLLLRAGVWKIGGWGFPTGILLPLALVGLFVFGRRLPPPVVAMPVLTAAAIVLVFVSARYRVALAPVAAVLACATGGRIVRDLRSRHFARAASLGFAVASVSVVSAFAGPFAQERTDYRTERLYAVGMGWVERAGSARERGDAEATIRAERRARELLDAAIEREPGYAPAHANLGAMWLRSGEVDRADAAFAEALRLDPSNETALRGRARTLLALGRTIEARRHAQEMERIAEQIRREALAR